MSSVKSGMFWLSVILVISIPILLYIYNFGIGLWDTDQQWANLGSYFGGVLGPVLSFVSIILLWFSLVSTQSEGRESIRLLEKQVNLILRDNFDRNFYASVSLLVSHSQRNYDLDFNTFKVDNEPLISALRSLNKPPILNDANVLWREANGYFMTVIYLLNLIDEADEVFCSGDKYAELIKSQLCSDELLWIHFVVSNCAHSEREKALLKWLN